MSRKRTGIMLAIPFEMARFEKWDKPVFVQPKLNGIRCRTIFNKPNLLQPSDKQLMAATLLSSTGLKILSVPHIEREMNIIAASIPNTEELDGELYCHGMTFEEIEKQVEKEVRAYVENNHIR